MGPRSMSVPRGRASAAGAARSRTARASACATRALAAPLLADEQDALAEPAVEETVQPGLQVVVAEDLRQERGADPSSRRSRRTRGSPRRARAPRRARRERPRGVDDARPRVPAGEIRVGRAHALPVVARRALHPVARSLSRPAATDAGRSSRSTSSGRRPPVAAVRDLLEEIPRRLPRRRPGRRPSTSTSGRAAPRVRRRARDGSRPGPSRCGPRRRGTPR